MTEIQPKGVPVLTGRPYLWYDGKYGVRAEERRIGGNGDDH
ncbi:hypothetical protein CLOSTASPAR_02948 [[Clostridium] asparagiforme DSM 15981]|uniref:Uncharacterized protein n=1 Tax=[Clostridium] asparagiforme DSM 15981 TaxID=518636 RepID=C0D111_9FIRM|nr:hypothetical protein CLOSTASPAR_02948 [[Clostridium] asparagiforme DSM 15981]